MRVELVAAGFAAPRTDPAGPRREGRRRRLRDRSHPRASTGFSRSRRTRSLVLVEISPAGDGEALGAGSSVLCATHGLEPWHVSNEYTVAGYFPSATTASGAARSRSPTSAATSCSFAGRVAVDGYAGASFVKARDDAARAERGGHRRRTDRVPSQCRGRLRDRDRQPVRRRNHRDPRAVRARGRPPPPPRGRRRHASAGVGHADGAYGRDRASGRIGSSTPTPTSSGGLAAGRSRTCWASCPTASASSADAGDISFRGRTATALRRADDRAALHPGLSGRQGQDLPRAPEGRSSRRSGRRDRGRQSQRDRARRWTPLRGWHPIEVLHFSSVRSSRSRGRREAAGCASPVGEHDRAPSCLDARVRESRLAEFFAAHAVSDEELERGVATERSPSTPGFATCSATLRGPDGSFRAPRRGTLLTFPPPDVADAAAYAAEASVLAEIDAIVRAESSVACARGAPRDACVDSRRDEARHDTPRA